MRSFLLLVSIIFMAILLLSLRGCYYEIFDPMKCEKIWPMAKGKDYYLCVKARALQNGFYNETDNSSGGEE